MSGLTWMIFLPILLGVCAPFLAKLTKQSTGWVFALLPLGMTAYLATYIPAIFSGDHSEPITQSMAWVPSLGVQFSLYLDGLSLMMALLVAGMGALIFIYAGGYLEKDAGIGRFYLYLSLFMSAMLGVVLAGNLITLFTFWELTSISSYLLIGYKHAYKESHESAKQALLVTGGGGLVLFAGLILLGMMGGSFEWSELLAQPPHTLGENPLYLGALLCILVGAFTKSAQLPFQFWLPGAMVAPTPVSAYLHSATMVKAGVYLLARVAPLLAGTDAWFYLVTGVGAATMIVGAFLSWQNRDLKKILAYSTISVLGTLVMLLGLSAGNEAATQAAVIFLLAHAFYKGSLFMIAGSIDHATGTRDITKLAGLRHKMPLTFIAAILAALSKAGIPLLLGFVGKELLYEGTLHAPANYVAVLTGLSVVANGMVGASAALVVLRPFFGKEVYAPHAPHEVPLSMWFGPVILSTIGLAIGVFPALLDGVVDGVAKSISAESSHAHLAVFHFPLIDFGRSLFAQPFFLSILTITLAALIYFLRDRLVPLVLPLRGDRWGSQRWYQVGLKGVVQSAESITHWLQNGDLRWYLQIILGTTVVLVGYPLIFQGGVRLTPDWFDVKGHELLLLVILIAAAIQVTRTNSRLIAIASLGVVGFSVALFFVLFQAPDLAMTQFSIETLSVILLALIIGRLPVFTQEKKRDSWPALLLSVAVGGLTTLIVMVMLSTPSNSLLTPYISQNSYDLAKGRNVVNVILVDFRGFDTMGELTVVATAGIGVYALARMNKKSAESTEERES